MLKRLLSTILPGDSELNIPGASQLNIAYNIEQEIGHQTLTLFFELLEQLSNEKFVCSLPDLDPEQLVNTIEFAKRKNVRLISSVILCCLNHYYTNPMVLAALSKNAVPPYPEGNQLAADDWHLLESVIARGTIYKKVTDV